NLHEILRRDRERDRVADGLVEPVVRAVAVDDRLSHVGALIEVVPELVVNRREVFRRLLDARLDAYVGQQVDIPGAGVAHDVAIARPDKLRAVPKRRRERLEAERGIETLADADHLEWRDIAPLEDGVQRVPGARARWLDQRLEVGPVLCP